MNPTPTERTLTELDHVRLKRLVQRRRQEGAASAEMAAIDDLLDEARLLPSTEVTPDLVTMNSELELEDLTSGRRQRLTVCYPADARPDEGRVSALSPIGWAVLGLHLGDTARWTTPAGGTHTARIAAIVYQPEASGHYTT